jgi:hypothetical protein
MWHRWNPDGSFDALIEPFLRPREAADWLQMKKARLTALRRAGQGPRVTRLPDGRIRYAVSDLIIWQNNQPPSPNKEKPAA